MIHLMTAIGISPITVSRKSGWLVEERSFAIGVDRNSLAQMSFLDRLVCAALAENSPLFHVSQSVPQGRLRVAQHVVLGRVVDRDQSRRDG